VLVANGADIEWHDFSSSTPMEVARKKRHQKVAEFLQLVRQERERKKNDDDDDSDKSETYDDYDFVYSSSEVEDDIEEEVPNCSKEFKN
jgi:hypothetical protein